MAESYYNNANKAYNENAFCAETRGKIGIPDCSSVRTDDARRGGARHIGGKLLLAAPGKTRARNRESRALSSARV